MAGEVVAAFTLTITTFGFAISLAVLIFGGALESGLSRGIGSFVVGSGVMAIVLGQRSSIVPVATYIQEAPAILMAAVAAGFITREGAEVADVFVLLAVSTVATALTTTLLAHFGLGELVRNFPRPVIRAFLGGTGWLLLKGGLDVMTNSALGLADLGWLFELDVAKLWVPGIAIGVTGWLASRSSRVPDYGLGVILCTCLAGFYVVAVLTSSVSAIESGGWLLGPFPEASGMRVVTPHEIRTAHWSGIAKTAPGIASVVGLTCVAQLCNLTGIRSELVPRLDVDAELRSGSGANLAASLFGVPPGFHALGITLLLDRLGARRRAVSIVSGCALVVLGIVGVAAVGYVPRFVVGAMLVMIGVTMLDDWARGLMRAVDTSEALLGGAIVGAIAWFGLLPGLLFGFVAAGTLFILSCSRVDPVRLLSTGHQHRSRVARAPEEVQRLTALRDRLVVCELRGYVFFGSLISLEDQLRLLAPGPIDAETMIVDFANVTGVDSSGSEVIVQLIHDLRVHGLVIWLSGLDSGIRETLLVSEPRLAGYVTFSPSLESALESVEDYLLASNTPDLLHQQPTRTQTTLSPQLLSHCVAHRFPASTIVMAHGTSSDGLLIVQRDRLAAFRVEADGTRARLRSFGEFTILQAGLIDGVPRTLKVVAESCFDGWWLSAERFHELRLTQPELASELYHLVVRTEGERSSASFQEIDLRGGPDRRAVADTHGASS